MRLTRGKLLGSAGLLPVLLLATGCLVTDRPGQLRTEEQVVEAQGAQSAEVNLTIGAGELRVSGGAEPLMVADFTYNLDEWQPQIDYSVRGGRGVLTVTQPEASVPESADIRYEWDIRLNDDIPLDLSVTLGAGASNLDLSQLDLRTLTANVGAGEGIVILTGDYAEDVSATIRGGVGGVTVLFSNDVGVRVEVAGGLGSITAEGFSQDGRVYTNDAYGTSDVTLDVSIEGAVGSIQLQLVD